MHDSILFPEGITPFPACFHARGNAGSRPAGAGAGRRLNDLLAVDVLGRLDENLREGSCTLTENRHANTKGSTSTSFGMCRVTSTTFSTITTCGASRAA